MASSCRSLVGAATRPPSEEGLPSGMGEEAWFPRAKRGSTSLAGTLPDEQFCVDADGILAKSGWVG